MKLSQLLELRVHDKISQKILEMVNREDVIGRIVVHHFRREKLAIGQALPFYGLSVQDAADYVKALAGVGEDERLMEIKVPGAYPLELIRIMEKLGIRQTSFSKYGRAYMMEVSNEKKRGNNTGTGAGSKVA